MKGSLDHAGYSETNKGSQTVRQHRRKIQSSPRRSLCIDYNSHYDCKKLQRTEFLAPLLEKRLREQSGKGSNLMSLLKKSKKIFGRGTSEAEFTQRVQRKYTGFDKHTYDNEVYDYDSTLTDEEMLTQLIQLIRLDVITDSQSR